MSVSHAHVAEQLDHISRLRTAYRNQTDLFTIRIAPTGIPRRDTPGFNRSPYDNDGLRGAAKRAVAGC